MMPSKQLPIVTYTNSTALSLIEILLSCSQFYPARWLTSGLTEESISYRKSVIKPLCLGLEGLLVA